MTNLRFETIVTSIQVSSLKQLFVKPDWPELGADWSLSYLGFLGEFLRLQLCFLQVFQSFFVHEL